MTAWFRLKLMGIKSCKYSIETNEEESNVNYIYLMEMVSFGDIFNMFER